MNKTVKEDEMKNLVQALEKDLLDQYGPVLTGANLQKALGYPSMDAMRQAIFRKQAPVPMFKLKNRRGRFALAKDIASWLATQRCQIDV